MYDFPRELCLISNLIVIFRSFQNSPYASPKITKNLQKFVNIYEIVILINTLISK